MVLAYSITSDEWYLRYGAERVASDGVAKWLEEPHLGLTILVADGFR